MPRVSRLRCASCNVVVENNRYMVNVLLKLYLSARTGNGSILIVVFAMVVDRSL